MFIIDRYDSPPSYTYTIRGQKAVWIATTGGQKGGFTIALCAFADAMKLPALIIFKERGGKLAELFRTAIKCPDNIKITDTTNGWMTTEKLMWWTRGMWKEAEDGERRLLLLHNYKPHYGADTQFLLGSLDIDLIYIPAGCTGIGKPMDVSINAPFNRKIVDSWVEWHRVPTAHTPAGNIKQPTRQQQLI